MPDAVSGWSTKLPIGDDDGVAFTEDETASLVRMEMLRSTVDLMGRDAER